MSGDDPRRPDDTAFFCCRSDNIGVAGLRRTRLAAAQRARSTGLEPALAGGSSQVLTGNAADSKASETTQSGPSRPSAESTVTLSHGTISEALEAARAEWLRTGDERALRQALLELIRNLESRTP